MRPQGVRGEMFCSLRRPGPGRGAIADGVGEVRRAVREQVRQGANQIKIMAGGGVSSPTIRSTARSSRWTNCAPPSRRPRPPTSTCWRTPIHRAR
jgi:hypothetical protein